MIVSSINQKGGSGKSIVSQNLAVQYSKLGYRTAIVDSDPSQNSMTWFANRAEDTTPLSVFSDTNHRTLRKTVTNLYDKEGFQVVIIDSPPTLQKIAMEIILLSHLVIIPIQTTGGNDIWSTEQLAEMIEDVEADKEVKINAYFLVNRFQPQLNVSKMFLGALESHSEAYNIGMLETKLHQRTVYGLANIYGRGVVEESNTVAAKEIETLAQELESIYKTL